MKRIFPRNIQDKFFLSEILCKYLAVLQDSPLQVRVEDLAFDTRIQAVIFRRLANLSLNPDDATNIASEDYHILFSNILIRYPTVKIWQQDDGGIFIEL